MTFRGLQSSSRNQMEQSGQIHRARRASCRCRQKPYCGEMLLRSQVDLVDVLQRRAVEDEKTRADVSSASEQEAGELAVI